ERPTEGRIFLDGVDITDMPPYERPINMMFQSYALFPHMSVADNIAFGLKQDRMSKDEIEARVAEMLKLVHMTQYAKRKPHQLSGGQRQRVALAREVVEDAEGHALIASPELERKIYVGHGVTTSVEDKRITYALRPEKLLVTTEQPSFEFNWSHGKVHDIAYLGGHSVFYVELPGGKILVLNLANYGLLTEDELYIAAYLGSLKMALISTILCLAIG
uniref:ABC transporter ATP-binding protein n=1 Tax=Steinernema glaseri TaxID=37863 RepID=A0A1I7YX79_9BILA